MTFLAPDQPKSMLLVPPYRLWRIHNRCMKDNRHGTFVYETQFLQYINCKDQMHFINATAILEGYGEELQALEER